jgi:hypothetical protein
MAPGESRSLELIGENYGKKPICGGDGRVAVRRLAPFSVSRLWTSCTRLKTNGK